MSINVTIMICTTIVGVVVLGAKWIDAAYKKKEVADANTLCHTANEIMRLVDSCLTEFKGMREKIELMHGTEMCCEKHLDAIKQNVIRNVGIKSLIDSVRHTNSLIEANCTILKSEVGNIYSETASIDSRLNGYFGEKFNTKE